MTQNCLPEIYIRLDNYKKIEPIIHSTNKVGKKSINNQRYEWLKHAALHPHQKSDQFVRISFSNKTALFKRKRLASIQNCQKEMFAPLQYHKTRKSSVLLQSPRTQTEPSINDLRVYKSLLNPKSQSRNSSLNIGEKYLLGVCRKKRSNFSLIDFGSEHNFTPVKYKQEKEQFMLSPWGDKQDDVQKQNRLGRFR